MSWLELVRAVVPLDAVVGAALGGVDPAAELHPLPHQHLEDAYGVPQVRMNTFTIQNVKQVQLLVHL